MANKYDEVYNYRLATIEDVNNIMDFIRLEWAENHILANNKDFFIWMYGRDEYGDNKSINFVLMTDKSDNVLGVLGFVPYDEKNESISPALTMVKPEGLLPMSGLEFMKRQMQLVGEKEHFSFGTNPNTIKPLYEKVFHMSTGVMKQYFIINPDRMDFRVASPEKGFKCLEYVKTGYSFEEIHYFDEVKKRIDLDAAHERMVFKSPEYINKRFFEHPIYSYRKWIIKDDSGKDIGIIFGRDIERDGTKLLRLVDYRGDLNCLKKLGKPLHDLIKTEDYEYIDLMVSDLSDYHLEEAGFALLDPEGKTIIPHYFEPFVRENKKICFQDKTNIVIFKADGDQDRPSTW